MPSADKETCRRIAQWIGQQHVPPSEPSRVRAPDEEERREKALDLLFEVGDTPYALEHTRVPLWVDKGSEDGAFKHLFGEPLHGKPVGPYHFLIAGGSEEQFKRALKAGRGAELRRKLLEFVETSGPTMEVDDSISFPMPDLGLVITLFKREEVGDDRLYVIRGPFSAAQEGGLRAALEKAVRHKAEELAKAQQEGACGVLLLEVDDSRPGPWELLPVLAPLLQTSSTPPDLVYIYHSQYDSITEAKHGRTIHHTVARWPIGKYGSLRQRHRWSPLPISKIEDCPPAEVE